MRFSIGFVVGGLVSSLLCGKPQPSSPIGQLFLWLIDDPAAPLTLRYFDIRGRGEAIRCALADHGVPFDDAAFSAEAWGKGRPDGLKAKLGSKLLFGQVPLVEVDGLALVQSHAILRHLSRRFGWDDSLTLAQKATADMLADGTEDVRKQLTAVKYDDTLAADVKAAKFDAWCGDGGAGGFWLGVYDRAAAEAAKSQGLPGRGPYIAGTPAPTLADYLLFDLLDTVEAMSPGRGPALVASLPGLAAWRAAMAARPGLKAYLVGPGRRPA